MNLQPVKQEQDLGLGSKVVQENRNRFINRDGSLNVYKKSVWERGAFSPYHAILSLNWTRFNLLLFAVFVFTNLVFAVLYFFEGAAAFPELANLTPGDRLLQLFFYSVQSLATLGASPLHPASNLGNLLLSVEVFLGLWFVALFTGLIFARFSNPATRIIFSENAVIAPYNDIQGFMFRIINGRNNELIEITATVTLSILDKNGKRQFQKLNLERDMVLVFPLNWTVVHPIDKTSPIWGMTLEDLARTEAEFLIYITAIDKDLSKKVYARFSYLYNEIIIGAQFAPMIEQTSNGTVIADTNRIHRIEKI